MDVFAGLGLRALLALFAEDQLLDSLKNVVEFVSLLGMKLTAH